MNTSQKQVCKTCDFAHAVRHGRCDWRCPHCGRQLMLEMFLMAEAGIDYTQIEGDKDGSKTTNS